MPVVEYAFPPPPRPASSTGRSKPAARISPAKSYITYPSRRPCPARPDSSAFDEPAPSASHPQDSRLRHLTATATEKDMRGSQESGSSSSLSALPGSVSPEKRQSSGRANGFYTPRSQALTDEDDLTGDPAEAGEDEEVAMDLDQDEEDEENRPSETVRSKGSGQMSKSYSGGSWDGDGNGRRGGGINGHMRDRSSMSRNGTGRSGRQADEDEDEDEEQEQQDEEQEQQDEEQEQWSEEESESETSRVLLHVEVCRNPMSPTRNPRPWADQTLISQVMSIIAQRSSVQTGTVLDHRAIGNDKLDQNLRRIWIAESEPPLDQVDPAQAVIKIHLYTYSDQEELSTFTAVAEEDDEADAVPAASVRELPSAALEGIWENLIYTSDLKPRMLRYIRSTMAFSQAEVDFNKVSWNRLLLLHGPPGTGKTSLCRGLAQKLVVRMSDVYDYGKLVEINSHSLFSKWFSESGKLVQKLFSTVTEMVADPRCLVVVMIDEVESLTAARNAAVNGSEPSDALRVVNALLTQLDKLKTKPNVLVMTTSNIPDTIDSAFIDRADEKFFVDYPPPQAVYAILRGCLEELRDKGMLLRCTIPMVGEAMPVAKRFVPGSITIRGEAGNGTGTGDRRVRLGGKEREREVGRRLADLARKCHKAQLAGRFLRRLPLLAHSRKLSSDPVSDTIDPAHRPRSIERWLDAFIDVVNEEIEDRARVGKKTSTKMGEGAGE